MSTKVCRIRKLSEWMYILEPFNHYRHLTVYCEEWEKEKSYYTILLYMKVLSCKSLYMVLYSWPTLSRSGNLKYLFCVCFILSTLGNRPVKRKKLLVVKCNNVQYTCHRHECFIHVLLTIAVTLIVYARYNFSVLAN